MIYNKMFMYFPYWYITCIIFLFILFILIKLSNKNMNIFIVFFSIHKFIVQLRKEYSNDDSLDYFLFSIVILLIGLNFLSIIGLQSPISYPYIFIIIGIIVLFISLLRGFKSYGLLFIFRLVPQDVPILLRPFLFVIELASFFTRNITTNSRIFINLYVGHLIVHKLEEAARLMSYKSLIFLPIITMINCLELISGAIQLYLYIMFIIRLTEIFNQH